MNKDELAKLPPEERLKKLKEMEEQAKKELAEAQKLMEQTKVELLKEEFEETTAPTQQDISHYLGVPSEDLEGAVVHAPSHALQESSAYVPALAQMRDMYSQLQDLSAAQILSRQQVTQVEEWYSSVNMIMANAVKYNDQPVQDIAQASRRIIKELLNEDPLRERYVRGY